MQALNELKFIDSFSVFDQGVWQILEPIMSVEITGPDEFQGTVMGQLNKRQSILTGTDNHEGWFSIFAEVCKQNLWSW